jgi:hypothetical protein
MGCTPVTLIGKGSEKISCVRLRTDQDHMAAEELKMYLNSHFETTMIDFLYKNEKSYFGPFPNKETGIAAGWLIDGRSRQRADRSKTGKKIPDIYNYLNMKKKIRFFEIVKNGTLTKKSS